MNDTGFVGWMPYCCFCQWTHKVGYLEKISQTRENHSLASFRLHPSLYCQRNGYNGPALYVLSENDWQWFTFVQCCWGDFHSRHFVSLTLHFIYTWLCFVGLEDCSPCSDAVVTRQSTFHARCHVIIYVFRSAVSVFENNFFNNICCFFSEIFSTNVWELLQMLCRPIHTALALVIKFLLLGLDLVASCGW